MSKLKEKRDASISVALRPVAPMLKSWFLDVGYDFMSSRNFNLQEEALIEELTDYYLERIGEFMVEYSLGGK